MKQYKGLHIIIKDVISQFGVEVLFKPTFVNLLLDFGAFKEIPQTRNIMQYMLSEGIISQIASIVNISNPGLHSVSFFHNNSSSKININEILCLAADISKRTSVNEEFAKYSIRSILYGLGVISDVELPQIGENLAKNNSQSIASVHTEDIDDDTQYVIMNIFPSDAVLVIDGNMYTLQNGIFAGEFAVGLHAYEVSSPQYISQSGTIDLQSSNKEEIKIALQLQNKSVDVTIFAEDRNTEILIDGISYGYGKVNVILSEAIYTIESKREKCYVLSERVSISGKKQIVKLGHLIQMCGSLKVNVTPVGCSVYLNGNDIGKTPLMVKNINVGEKHIRVVSPEGTEISTHIKIEENKSSVYKCNIPSLVFCDYSELKIGDWYYEDGTFSHIRVNNKKAVGIVYSLRTSAEESKHGWTHGQIIKIKENNLFEERLAWCKNDVVISETIEYSNLSNAVYKLQTSNEPSSLFKGYEISKLDILEDNPDFPVFLSVKKIQNEDLPIGLTSGWYIPNLYQCLEMVINLHDMSSLPPLYREEFSCKRKEGIQAEVFSIMDRYLDSWTSSSKDNNKAWTFRFKMSGLGSTNVRSKIEDKKTPCSQILVASF